MSAIDHVHYRDCASRSMDDLFRGACDCGADDQCDDPECSECGQGGDDMTAEPRTDWKIVRDIIEAEWAVGRYSGVHPEADALASRIVTAMHAANETAYPGAHDDCIATVPHYHGQPYVVGDWSRSPAREGLRAEGWSKVIHQDDGMDGRDFIPKEEAEARLAALRPPAEDKPLFSPAETQSERWLRESWTAPLTGRQFLQWVGADTFAAGQVRAALSTPDPAPAAALDVERLAEALYFTLSDPVTEPFHGEGEQRIWVRHAKTLRARLSTTPSQDPPETT